MAAMVNSSKFMKKGELRKSHSWWWDSHISSKNSRWLTENLEEMDQSVKRMLKLIEQDGDSFARKAEMYYQKRPELISYVEEFYRMYRALAERYDHVTGELRKNIPSDLQSQNSGISDIGSEPPSPNHKLGRHKSGPRAAGFEFFLGSGGSSSDLYQKEGDESSTLTDSEPESDDSSVNNYSGLSGNSVDQGLRRKNIDLEIELREVKEKLRIQHEENADASSRGSQNEYSGDLLDRIAGYERQLGIANEKIRSSSEEIARLKNVLQEYGSSEFKRQDAEAKVDLRQSSEFLGLEERSDPCSKIQALTDELRITKERVHGAEKELALSKVKLNSEKREISKLHERAARLKSSLSDRDHEIRDLKMAVSDAEEKIFPEKKQIKAKISRLLEEQNRYEEELREWESRGRSLEEEIRRVMAEKITSEEKLKGEIKRLNTNISKRDDRIRNLSRKLDDLISERDKLNAKTITLEAKVNSREDQIDQMDKNFHRLQMEHTEIIIAKEGAHIMVKDLRSQVKDLEEEVERQKSVIMDRAEEKREAIRQLCFSLEHYRSGYHSLRRAIVGHRQVVVLAS